MVKRSRFLYTKKSLEDRYSKDKNNIRVWIHLASIGESKVLENIYHDLKKKYNNNRFLITVFSSRGYYSIKSRFPEDIVLLAPFDLFFFSYLNFIEFFGIKKVIIIETEIWPFLLYVSNKKHLEIIGINSFMTRSTRNFWYRIYSMFSFNPIKYFSKIILKDKRYKYRYKVLKYNGKIIEGFNLKYKLDYIEYNKINERKKFNIDNMNFVISFISIREGEFKIALKYIKCLKNLDRNSSYFKFKFILIPRHISESKILATILKREFYYLYSEIEELLKKENFIFDRQFLIVDKYGVVDTFLKISDLSIVGGTFDEKIGGHNIVEPIFYKVGVIFGPYIYKQIEGYRDIIKKYNLGLMEKDPCKLASITYKIMKNEIRFNFPKNIYDKGKYLEIIKEI